MISISLEGLLGANTAALRAAAAHWEKLATDVDGTVEDLVGGTRDLPHHWVGDGASAAEERNRRLQLEVGNAQQYCVEIAAAVRGFADDVEHYRQMLYGVVAEARGRGMTIDLATGRITAPLTQPAGVRLAQAGVDSYLAQIEEILAKANDADRRARQVIEANQVGDQERPDQALPGVSTDFLTLATEPGYKARAWHDMHQLNRDRLVEEHPELVGPALGLPSADRDRANRLLLARAKAGLLARRARLDEMLDGAGSRAVVDVDRGLASIEEAERTDGYLLGYPPAVFGKGDPKWDDYVPPARG